MSDSVTVLENEAVSPTLMSAKANSFIAPSLLHRKRFSAQEASCDDHALHFGGAFIELRDLGIAIGPLDRVALRVSISTVDLDCPVSNARGGLGGEQLRHGCCGAVRQTMVLVPGCPVDQQASGVDLSGHVGDHPLNRLQRGNGLTELNAFLGVCQGRIERPLSDPQSLGGNSNSSAVKGRHRNLETLAFLSEQGVLRNAAVREVKWGRAGCLDP